MRTLFVQEKWGCVDRLPSLVGMTAGRSLHRPVSAIVDGLLSPSYHIGYSLSTSRPTAGYMGQTGSTGSQTSAVVKKLPQRLVETAWHFINSGLRGPAAMVGFAMRYMFCDVTLAQRTRYGIMGRVRVCPCSSEDRAAVS